MRIYVVWHVEHGFTVTVIYLLSVCMSALYVYSSAFFLLESLCGTSKSYRIQLRDAHTRNSNTESSDILVGVVFFFSHIWIFLCGLNVFLQQKNRTMSES